MATSFVFFCLLCLLSLGSGATVSHRNQYCSEAGPNFTKGSPFEENRDLALSSLSSNGTFDKGFYNFTAGHDPPDVVYSNFLCRGDITADICQECVVDASKMIVQKCPRQKAAIVAYDECTLRFSNKSFFSIMEAEPSIPLANPQKFESSYYYFYLNVLGNMMTNLVSGVAHIRSPAKRFVTEEVNVTGWDNETVLGTMYGLVQCTPDISVSACQECLRKGNDVLHQCCGSKTGVRAVLPSCNVRYEVYPFYNMNATTPPPGGMPNASRPDQTMNATAPPPGGNSGMGGRKALWITVGTSVPMFLVVVLLHFGIFYIWRRKKADKEENRTTSQQVQSLEFEGGGFVNDYPDGKLQSDTQVKSQEFPLIRLDLIHAATQHFSDENKLGEGGFGPVYKGTFVHGKEIAVKRLSRNSRQGLQEFKNEVTLIAKLQHKNLVRLLGCCLEKDELLLIYEYMPNKSLDVFLFDPTRGAQLDWKRRLNIIHGIVRGLLYLHEDSRLRIIHRDLKTSNVLLDLEMNPKISDFGMARIFGGNQSEANTNRVVGTYGYMAPEYAMEGLFSVKSDVFSFGVLLLEIISGKKNNGFYLSEQGQSLLSFAWKLWSEGQGLELVDPLIVQSCVIVEVLKCIHIGLLCVQEDPADRPTMSTVAFLLASNSVTLPQPMQPAFSIGRIVPRSAQSTPNITIFSVNEATLSDVSPR